MADGQHYDCKEAFRRIDDFLDRELTSEEMDCVKVHLTKCGECAEEFHFEEEVIKQLKSKLGHIDLPPDLLEKIRSAIESCDSTKE